MSANRKKSGGITGIRLKLNKRNPESTDTITKLPVESIPTTIGEDKLNVLTDGDESPYFFAQAIQFPVEGNGDVYGEEFFKSFVERNKEYAFPGDKYGHSTDWCARQASHFFQVGAVIVGNVAYFKFYVPPETDSESNNSFIKEIKANGIDLSLVSKVKYDYNEDDRKYYMIESVGGERNDAVGYGEGSMDQVVINKNKDIEEGLEVNKEELLIKLNAMMANGDLTVSEVMKALNKEDLLKTEDDKASIAVLNSLKVELGDKPLEKAKELVLKVNTDADAVKEAELKTAFGEVLNADGSKNMIRRQGELLLGDKVINAENIEAVKKDEAFIAISGQLADENSKFNKINDKKEPGNKKTGTFAKM